MIRGDVLTKEFAGWMFGLPAASGGRSHDLSQFISAKLNCSVNFA